MEPRRPKQSPGDPNGAHRAKSNDLAMLCYVPASEKLEFDWACDCKCLGSIWASCAPLACHLT